MKYSSADIFSAIEKAIQTERMEDSSGDYDNLLNAIGDLQSVVDVVYRQENFNPELQDAYDIAKFVLEEMEDKYEFGVWESEACCPSLEHTSIYTADAIRTFQGGDVNETKTAVAKANVLANVLSDHSREVVHISLKDRPAIERDNLTSVARFVSSMIVKRVQEEKNMVESTTDGAAEGQPKTGLDLNVPYFHLIYLFCQKHGERVRNINNGAAEEAAEDERGTYTTEGDVVGSTVEHFFNTLFNMTGEHEAQALCKALDDALSSTKNEPATDKAA